MAEAKKKSTKTTVGGYMGAAGVILLLVATMLTGEGEVDAAATATKVLSWLQVAGISLTGLGATLTGLFARDDDKSSEDVGAK